MHALLSDLSHSDLFPFLENPQPLSPCNLIHLPIHSSILPSIHPFIHPSCKQLLSAFYVPSFTAEFASNSSRILLHPSFISAESHLSLL